MKCVAGVEGCGILFDEHGHSKPAVLHPGRLAREWFRENAHLSLGSYRLVTKSSISIVETLVALLQSYGDSRYEQGKLAGQKEWATRDTGSGLKSWEMDDK